MDNCSSAVDGLLRQRRSRSNRDGLPGSVVAQKLAALPASCRSVLRDKVEELLAESGGREGDVAAVLNALVMNSDPEAIRLASTAIRDPNMLVKEDYASMLDELGRPDEAVAGLLAVLEDGTVHSDRADLTTTIRALHALQATESRAAVARYLDHPDTAVRGAAVTFLTQFDEDGGVAADRFVSRIARETDPDVLELLIDGLRHWGRRPDPTVLRRILDDDDAPPSLRDSARRALASEDDS